MTPDDPAIRDVAAPPPGAATSGAGGGMREGGLDDAVEHTFPASDPVASTAQVVADGGAAASRHVSLYRVVGPEDADAPFTSHTDRSGRWTSGGTHAAYASLSAAGAILEFLAHLEGATPKRLHLVVAAVPADCIEPLSALPDAWQARPYRENVRAVGDAWAREQRSLALQVPSALAPREANVLVNPRHADFGKLQVLSCDALQLDERLRI